MNYYVTLRAFKFFIIILLIYVFFILYRKHITFRIEYTISYFYWFAVLTSHDNAAFYIKTHIANKLLSVILRLNYFISQTKVPNNHYHSCWTKFILILQYILGLWSELQLKKIKHFKTFHLIYSDEQYQIRQLTMCQKMQLNVY